MIVQDQVLLAFCEAIMAPIGPMEEVIRGDDTHDPYERAVDVGNAPLWVLPWLACIVGIEWHGPATEDLRSLLIERPRYRRGTIASIRAAAQQTLTGTKTVDISNRFDDNPWLIRVTTLPSETPDPETTEKVVLSEIPVWVRLITGREPSPTIDQASPSVTIDGVAANVTIDAVTAVDVA